MSKFLEHLEPSATARYCGLSIYRPNRLLCEDGKVRSIMVRSYYDGQRWAWYGDTYFSVPARIRVKGKTVRGIVTNIGEYDSDATTGFCAFTSDPNAGLIAKLAPAELDRIWKGRRTSRDLRSDGSCDSLSLVSAAVSLKRIADALERQTDPNLLEGIRTELARFNGRA